MRHILIVDDMPANLEYAIALLQDKYQVAAAKSGAKALTYLSKNKPDLILLDVKMPEMDGFETIEKIKSDPEKANIPVIFLTADRDAQTELKGLKMGAVDFISKPFEPAIMLSRIEMQIELNDYRTNLEQVIKEKTNVIERMLDIISISLAELVESRDDTTGGHLKNTTDYFRILVEHMRRNPKYSTLLNNDYVRNLYRAAPLHDIGKIAIDDAVLRKESGLDKNEFEYMKSHSVIGARTFDHILSTMKSETESLNMTNEIEFIKVAREMALYHHEKWCGTGGYPAGIAGEDIPLSARMLTLPDVYDALTSKRPYKEPFSHKKAMEIISEGRGVLFDPEITDIFLECSPELEACLKAKRIAKGEEIITD